MDDTQLFKLNKEPLQIAYQELRTLYEKNLQDLDQEKRKSEILLTKKEEYKQKYNSTLGDCQKLLQDKNELADYNISLKKEVQELISNNTVLKSKAEKYKRTNKRA